MSLTYDGPTLTLVVNPTAGRGRARKLLPRVCRELLGMPGANLRVHQTTTFAEARQRTIAAVAGARPAHDGVRGDALLVMGGDGMMTLGVNACAGTDVPLGLIPAGTGNDLCRGMGLHAYNPLPAAREVIAGFTRRVDVLEVRGRLVGGAEKRYVGSVVATGFDSRVNRRANSMKLPIGNLRYAASALAELATFEPLHYRLTVDGTVRNLPAMFIAIGNASCFGGGMRICPTADVSDGLLDVTVIHPVSRATLLRLLPTMFSGGFVKDPAVERFTATEVTVQGHGLFGMGDGEELGDAPLHIRLVPQALSVFGPGAKRTPEVAEDSAE